MAFDTLAFSRRLETAGMDREIAEAMAATKADLDAGLAEVRAAVRADLLWLAAAMAAAFAGVATAVLA